MPVKEVITLPPGRVISGNLTELQPVTNMQTKKPEINDDGTPKMTYWFRIAIPKTSPELYDNNGVPGVFSKLILVANRAWPTELNGDSFSWKIKDGDGTQNDGKQLPDYCKGCYLFTVRNNRIAALAEPDGNGGWKILIDTSKMYLGCHVMVGISVVNNGSQTQPGIYLNSEFAALVKHDKIINPGGVSIGEISGYLGQSQVLADSPYAGTPAMAPMQQQTPAMAPMQQQQTPAMAPMQQFTMTPAANGLTREQYHAAKWTDKQLIDAGFMNVPSHETILN